jgi:hypothetical protein
MNAAEPVQQRPTEQDRDPARARVHVDLVDVRAFHVCRVEDELTRLAAVADPYPMQLQQPADDLDVAYPWYVVEPARTAAQRGGDHGLETRFFAPRTRTWPCRGAPPWTVNASVNATSGTAQLHGPFARAA